MSSIEWMGLLTLVMLFFLLLGLLMFRVRAKYIHIEVQPEESRVRLPDQNFEPYRYEVERYGCVSLLATVLGVFFCAIAVISFVALLYQIVVNVIIPSLPILFSTVVVLFGIFLVFSFGLFVAMLVLGFFKDLFNPPR
jgi:hypothetical protein